MMVLAVKNILRRKNVDTESKQALSAVGCPCLLSPPFDVELKLLRQNTRHTVTMES